MAIRLHHDRAIGVQSLVNCRSEFLWMNNGQGQSPCLIAGYLRLPCAGSYTIRPCKVKEFYAFTITPLNVTSNHYSFPGENNTVVNDCVCSWASYNMIQACALCQFEHGGTAVQGWNEWITNCPKDNQQFYPTNLDVLAPIPFYATKDPKTWPNQIFDETTAFSIRQEGNPDVTQASRSQERPSSNLGPILGGVLGGLTFLAIVAFCSLFIYRRRARQRRSRNGSKIDENDPHNDGGLQRHARVASGSSAFSYASSTGPMIQAPSLGYANTASNTAGVPSIASGLISAPVSMVVTPSMVPGSIPSTTSSPPPNTPGSNSAELDPPLSPSAVINPFVLPPLQTASGTAPDRRNPPCYKEQVNPPAYSSFSSPEERVMVSLVADSTVVATSPEEDQPDMGPDAEQGRQRVPADRKRR